MYRIEIETVVGWTVVHETDFWREAFSTCHYWGSISPSGKARITDKQGEIHLEVTR